MSFWMQLPLRHSCSCDALPVTQTNSLSPRVQFSIRDEETVFAHLCRQCHTKASRHPDSLFTTTILLHCIPWPYESKHGARRPPSSLLRYRPCGHPSVSTASPDRAHPKSTSLPCGSGHASFHGAFIQESLTSPLTP